MNLLNILLKSMLSDSSVNALAKKTGVKASKLAKLIPLALPLLLKFMTRNASTQSGAMSLLGALSQHTNTKSMPEQLDEADTADGEKIIGHILGDETDNAVISLSQETGMSNEEVTRALGGLAPALLSGLSAATASAAKPAANKVDLSDGLDLSDVMAMLNGGSSNQNSGFGLLGSLLGGASAPAQQQATASASPLGGLLGSLLGGSAAQSQQQTTASASPLGGLLGSLLGGSAVQPQQQTVSPLGGMLGSMLGAAPSADDNSLNGNALLGILSGLMRQ